MQNEKRQPRFSWSVSLLTFLVLTTHLTGGLLIAAELIVLALARPKTTKPILISLGTGCLAALPLMLVALSVFENRGQWAAASGAAQLFDDWRNPLLLQWIPAVLFLAKFWHPAKWMTQKSQDGTKSTYGLRNAAVLAAAWMIVPLLLSLVLDYFSIPVASYRYTTVVSLAPPVLIGLALAMIHSRNMVIVCAFMIVVGDLALNPVAYSLVEHSRLPQYRLEDWESTIGFANDADSETEKLVFLFSNIYEDAQALENQSSSFQSYLRFPVAGIYKLDADHTVIPMPTLAQAPWKDEHLQQLFKNGGAIAICRIDDYRLEQIQKDLSHAIQKRDRNAAIESFSQPGNSLKVLKLVVEEKR